MRYVHMLKWMSTGWVGLSMLSIVHAVLGDMEAGVRSMLLSLIGLTMTVGFLALVTTMRKPSVAVHTYGGGGAGGVAGTVTIGSSAGGSGHVAGDFIGYAGGGGGTPRMSTGSGGKAGPPETTLTGRVRDDHVPFHPVYPTGNPGPKVPLIEPDEEQK